MKHSVHSTLIRSISAFICIAIICFSVNSISGNIAEIIKAQPASSASNNASAAVNANSASAQQNSDPASQTDTTTPAASQQTTSASSSTPGSSSSNSSSSSKKSSSSSSSASAPSSVSAIVAYYNKATALVTSAKAGFSKKAVNNVTNLDMGALTKIGKSAVEDFLGKGTKACTIKKGSANVDPNYKDKRQALKTSTLAASDVSSATCSSASGKYIITIKIRNVTVTYSNCVYTKFTRDIASMTDAKNGLADINCTCDPINAKLKNSYIKAVCDAKTGKLSSLQTYVDMDVKMTNIKYTIIKVSQATANVSSSVYYTNFVW